MKVLLVEDEKDLSRAESTILTTVGYDVSVAYDGIEALEYLEKNDCDVIIMDIMMPRMNGIEALKVIRERGDFTPVILLTAKSETDDKVIGLDAGADDYLTKPFAMKELVARVKSMTRRNEAYSPKNLKVGSVTLNTEKQEITSENSISLTFKETKLLEFLMMNEGKEFSTERLLEEASKMQSYGAQFFR